MPQTFAAKTVRHNIINQNMRVLLSFSLLGEWKKLC